MSKQEVLEVINALPENASFEDVMYSLYVANNVKKGIEDAEAGRTFTHNEVKAMFSSDL
ncbi:MAG: hypothetical protein IJE27_01845 [Anaerotignum sp.]|nr:hypothetical protein [Anaerotignum sp.]